MGDYADIKIGRQILTWGTGDLVFLNDMFPKDWQSFFIGRDSEYLKAPSDAVRLGIFTDFINVDMVYTPKFDPDNFVTGEYLSHWDSFKNKIVGDSYNKSTDCPDKWFEDDEFAIRLYKNINNNEYALYGYNGFWKTPAGNIGYIDYFPKLRVIGFSARGQVGKGIANLEYAYYKSLEDKTGVNPLIKNSLSKYLIGYSMDLWQDFNASLQYYVEQIDDYSNYKNTFIGNTPLEQRRDIITLQLTELLMNQNLEVLLPIYYSPTDKDSYLRPSINYKYSDNMVMEVGANIFSGENQSTFFAQFENNTNVYFAIHYSLL